jgi:hypothetical protein
MGFVCGLPVRSRGDAIDACCDLALPRAAVSVADMAMTVVRTFTL